MTNRRTTPCFTGRLYADDLDARGTMGTWVRLAQVDSLFDEIELQTDKADKRRVKIHELRTALGELIRAYVNTLEAGRDRIVAMGGDCDPVDVMERGDPYLSRAKEALGCSDEPEEQS